MKNTVQGFNQNKLYEYGLDVKDAFILRYFVDFMDTGRMISTVFDDNVYYWVNYNNIKEDLPILGIKNNDAFRNRFKKLEKAGILVHYHKKEGGNFSYYNIGENYYDLITIGEENAMREEAEEEHSIKEEAKAEDDSDDEVCDYEEVPTVFKSAPLPTESSTLTHKRSEQNNLSTKDNNIYSACDIKRVDSAYSKADEIIQAVKKTCKILKMKILDEAVRKKFSLRLIYYDLFSIVLPYCPLRNMKYINRLRRNNKP